MSGERDESARHKAKMANRKAAQDAEVSAKTVEKGLLIVNTGKRLVLLDTGTGGQIAPSAGVLRNNLAAAGIDPKAVDASDLSMLEDLVTAAVNAALASSKDHMQKELGKISGGVKIPGLT
jgi:hypothetical protein